MHLFFWREAWRAFRAHRGLAATSILSLLAALLLCGVFLLLSYNAQQALNAVGDRREMIVYLKDGLDDSEIESLQDKIRELFGEPVYVTRAQAWEEFRAQVGDPELLAAVDENPLPASLRVRLKPELLNFAAMTQAAQQVAAFPEVEDVRYGAEYVRRLDEFSAGMHRGTVAAGAVVALAIVLVLFNTLRLAVLARRAQIEIQLKLGASDRFIATPYVIEAVIQTMLATGVALLLLWGLEHSVSTRPC